MTQIIVPTTRLSDMIRHAESAYPHECCGGLLGHQDGNTHRVDRIMPIQNNWDDTDHETKARRFKITPLDYRNLEKSARSFGLVVVGIYHSHPDHPAIPSDTDRQYAWPVFSYPILSIQNGRFSTIQSYRFVDGSFIEELVGIE